MNQDVTKTSQRLSLARLPVPKCNLGTRGKTKTQGSGSLKLATAILVCATPLRAAAAVVLLVASFVTTGTFAATKQFDGGTSADPGTGTSTSWNSTNGFSWRVDGVPTSTDDVLFDNAFRPTLQNVQLGGSNSVTNSLTIDLTTNQAWILAASSGTSAATLTLTNGNITRNNEATNNSLVAIGATTGTGIGTGIMTLATSAAGFTVANQDTDATLAVQAIISGATKTLSVTGAGTVSFIGPSANTYTGKTTVSGGLLVLNKTADVTAISSTGATGATAATTDLQITGGTVRIDANNQIVDTAKIGLSGGTLRLNGVQEGTTTTAGVGALTLSANSIIDLASTSLLHFDASNGQAWSGTLSIYNYSGTAYTGNAAEQLLFGSNGSGLTQAQLDSISFYSGVGTGFLGTAGFAPDMDGEIVPVPEPSTWAAGFLTAAALGYTQRRRFSRLLKCA